MWPLIIRDEKKVGKKFSPDFWIDWGPTKIKYSDKNLNSSKTIQSIYCIYSSYEEITIDDLNSIALSLTYECGDFGEHTILFSYDKKPSITYHHVWDYCVFSDFDSDSDLDICLYQLGLMDEDLSSLSHKKQRQYYIALFENQVISNINELDSKLSEFQKEMRKNRAVNNLNSILECCIEQLNQDPNNRSDQDNKELIARIKNGPLDKYIKDDFEL